MTSKPDFSPVLAAAGSEMVGGTGAPTQDVTSIGRERRLSVLICSLNYSPEPTATGKYTGELGSWLAARGHTVTAIVGFPHYPAWKLADGYSGQSFAVERDGLQTTRRTPHYIPPPAKVTPARRILMEISFGVLSLVHWLPVLFSRRRYSIVIAVCPPMQTALMPWLYGVFRRVPWIFHVQDFQVDAALGLGMLKGGRLGMLLAAVERFFLVRASVVSSITESMCARAEAKRGRRGGTWLVPNWADVHSILPGDRCNSFRSGLGLGGADILVMYAGAIGEKQGLEVVLELAQRMIHRPEYHFLLIGDGVASGRLRAEAARRDLANLRFLGVQPKDRLGEIFAAADIQLVIQRREAADLVMPSKLTNILASGRPCIATAASGTGIWALLEGRQLGRCVAPEDPDSLVKAVVELGLDAPLRDRMGKAARAYAEENLGIDAVLSGFERSLFELVDGKAQL